MHTVSHSMGAVDPVTARDSALSASIAPGSSRTWLPPVYFSLALFLFSGWMNFGSEAGDFKEFRLWLIHIANVGPVSALGHPFSGYSPPYIYALALISPAVRWIAPGILIKFVSYIGYGALVLAVRHLLTVAGHRHVDRATALFMLVPSLIANFAIMNQCDAFWGAGVVMAVAASIRRAHKQMFIWFGLAVSFKLQAAFAGPFILAVAIAQGVPFRTWLLAPIATLVAYLPAWLAGWPATDLLLVYFRQVGFFHNLSLNAPNIWMIVQWIFPSRSPHLLWLTTPATLAAILVCIGFVPWSLRYLRDASPQTMLRTALIGAYLAPSILPRMHERYFLMVDVLALVLGLLNLRRYWAITLCVQLGTTLAMVGHLSQLAIFATIGAYAMLIAIFLTIRLQIRLTENYTGPRPRRPAPWRSSPVAPAIRG